MPRLSKRARDELKANGLWRSTDQVAVPAKWAEGAALFSRLAEEANQVPIPRAPEVESDEEQYLEYYPEMASHSFGFHSVVEEYRVSDLAEVYPIADDVSSPVEDLCVGFFLALANRAVDSSTLEPTSVMYGIPNIPIPRQVAVALESVGEFGFRGHRVQYADIGSFVKSCLRVAYLVLTGTPVEEALSTLVYPASMSDDNFKFWLSIGLTKWCADNGFESMTRDEIHRALFSGFHPHGQHDGDGIPPDTWEAYRTLFWEYKDYPSFRKHVLSGKTLQLLWKLGYPKCDADLLFNKTVRDLCKEIDKFTPGFHLTEGSVYPNRALSPRGSLSQLVLRVGDGFLVPDGVSEEDAMEAVAIASTIGCGGVVADYGSQVLWRRWSSDHVSSCFSDLEPVGCAIQTT